MAAGCIYTYNGKEHSENEFKNLLLSGELDDLLPKEVVDELPVVEKKTAPVSKKETAPASVEPKSKSKLAKFKEKHLSQSKTENNATQKREVSESSQQQHKGTDVNRQKPEAVRSNSNEAGRESEEKVNKSSEQPEPITIGANGEEVKPDWSKDVESTAKALEGVDVSVANGVDLSKQDLKFRRSEIKSEAGFDYGLQRIIEGKDETSVGDGNRFKGKPDYVFQLVPNESTADMARTDGVESSTTVKRDIPLTQSEQQAINEAFELPVKERTKKLDEISKQIAERLKQERAKEKSEAYHKAKADGSNPELVKAVEDLLGKPNESKVTQEPIKPLEPKQTEEERRQHIQSLIEEKQQKVNEVTKPQITFDTGLSLTDLASTDEASRQLHDDYKSQLASLKNIVNCLWQ